MRWHTECDKITLSTTEINHILSGKEIAWVYSLKTAKLKNITHGSYTHTIIMYSCNGALTIVVSRITCLGWWLMTADSLSITSGAQLLPQFVIQLGVALQELANVTAYRSQVSVSGWSGQCPQPALAVGAPSRAAVCPGARGQVHQQLIPYTNTNNVHGDNTTVHVNIRRYLRILWI